MSGRIVIIDDDKLLLDFMEEHLSMNKYEVSIFESPVKALSYIEDKEPDLVISDVKMNEMTGDEVLARVCQQHSKTGIILMTGFGNINHSVNAIRKGAFDYITKPFTTREILSRVNRYFESREKDQEMRAVRDGRNNAPPKGTPVRQNDSLPARSKAPSQKKVVMVGKNPHICKLISLLPRIARNQAPVLIQGESGTGKEVYAHLIQQESDRAHEPYVKINCANLPTELVESTLFGHVKGAFTGAITDRKGAFDEADGGTLLLDEITEIDINVQAKLLRVLQEKEFHRVGSQKPVKVDVRIISTTNLNIREAIKEGRFREDLYYRLNVFPVVIPPLRDRREDIPLLAQHLIDRYSGQYGLPEKKPSKELLNFLMEQEWKGNVRELDNKIHRGVILAHERVEITIEDVEDQLFSQAVEELKTEVLSDLPLMPIEEMELMMIKKALERTGGNQKKAASMLGISDRTIRNKLRNIGWEADET
jgi:DNA-binding NtrC family response regulator